MRRDTTSRAGFTLIELVISMGIVGALLALGIPAFRSYGKQVSFDAQAESVATLVSEARTLALAPEADKSSDVVAYGVSVDGASKIASLNRYAGTSANPALSSQVRQLSIAQDVTVTRAPSQPVLFPIALLGEPVFVGGGDGTVVLTSLVANLRPTRTLVINASTGQVSVQ